MNPVKFIKRLIGGLNLDVNYNETPPTDFVGGYDVVDRSPSIGSEDGLLQPENNNAYGYDIGEIDTTIRKNYNLVIDITGMTTCTVTTKLTVTGAYTTVMDTAFTTGDLVTTFFNNFVVAFQLAYPTASFTSVTFSGNTVTSNLYIGEFNNGDYLISISDDSTVSGTYTINVINDAISIDKLGALVPTCFTNTDRSQQIYATPKSKELVTLTAVGTNVADELLLTFADPDLVQDGEEVYMYGNGVACYVTLTEVTSTTFTVDASFNNVTLTIQFPTGTFTIVKYRKTVSVIGYAVKNYTTDVWTYTELLRSTKLNFRTYKQIQAYGAVNNVSTSYNWTDFLNQIKRLDYYGEIIDGGFLTYYNPLAIYNLDTIDVESRLQVGTNTAKVSLSVATTTGILGRVGFSAGSKNSSCYAAFVRFRTKDGAYTTYSKASNVIWLYSSDLLEHSYGQNSGRALQIKIEQINYQLCDYVQVGIIEFTTSSWVGYSLPEVSINGNDTIYVADSGFNKSSYLDFNDAGTLLEQIPFVFENARSILPYTYYELAANVNLIPDRDLTAWAQDITLTVARRTFPTILNDTCENAQIGILAGINAYSKSSNVWMSLMPNDTYRFCVYVDWEDGSPTSTYWMKDKAITLGNEVTDTSSTPNLYQYYIKATNINLDYVLPDGTILKDIVKDIRFGRALCNPQVKTMGVYILSTNPSGSVYQMTESYYSAAADANIARKRLTMYSPDLQNTAGTLDYSSGDYVIGLESTIQNNYNTGNDYAVDFYGNNLTTVSSNTVAELTNLGTGSSSSITNLTKNPPAGVGIVQNRGTAVMRVANDMPYSVNYGVGVLYYISPYSTFGAYPQAPTETRFFVIPQDQWFNKETHDSSTVYSLYGGDCFPTKSYYKISEGIGGSTYNSVIGFYTFNRTNTGLRSGTFPFVPLGIYLAGDFLTQPTLADFPYDQYTYDACFTPRYIFQNSTAFNPNLPQVTKLQGSIFYSQKSVSYDLTGGSRVWLPLDRKDLEATYGEIVHIDVLLGFSETGLLIVWQSQRTTAQYFDNTANIKSNTGELLIGNGEIMGRKGVDFTEYGCEHKWTIIKGQNKAGKDLVYWFCPRKGTIMRLGADGTGDIVGDINSLLTNKTFLALQNQFNNPDRPAHNYGCHAVWNNQTKEYILTLTLIPKLAEEAASYSVDDFVADPDLTWGFEQFPVIYKSLIDSNTEPFSDTTAWTKYDNYDDDVFQIWTMVWNELDNKFKTFRTFNPKIYGQFNNTYVSSHPTIPNHIFEHNKNLNEALFYGELTQTAVTATTDPTLYRITGTGIESTFPSPFVVPLRTKYVVKINGKNYEVVGAGTNYLQMASVDNDDILPQVTITNFSYYIYNCQDPYIEGLANGGGGRYFHFGQKEVQSDDTLKRTEYLAAIDSLGTLFTQSFTNKSEEEFYNGHSEVQIKQDTTATPTDNEVGLNNVEGLWMKFKSIWRWGKSNKLLTTEIKALETQKTK